MVTSMRKIIWPRAPLSTATASPAGAEESEGEQRRRRATDNTPDTSPLPSKPFLERGTRDTQRVTEVLTGDRPLRTRELVLGDEAQPPDPPRNGLQPSCPPARCSQSRDRAPAASLPRMGAQRSREPTFFFAPPVTRGREGEQSREEGRLRSDPGEGRRRARECAAGRAAPTTPALALPPAPAYLPGSPRRLVPPAPS